MEFEKITETQILIIGAGPVGLLLANFFGKYRHRCIIIDKQETPINIPRAISIDDETLRIIQAVGLLEEFFKISKSVKGLQLCDQSGKLMFTLTKEPTSGFEASHLFYSPELEKLLRDKLNEYKSVTFLENTELLNINNTHNGAEASLLYQKKENQNIRCRYIIGCDGANSKVRAITGIKMKNLNFSATNLKVDVELNEEAQYSNWIKKYCSSKQKAFVFLDSWHKHKRIEFSLKRDQSENLEDYLEKTQQILNTRSFKILHSAVYSFQSKIADKWKKGNVLIAGDAAHLMPPYIGQGMCAGFRDAQNLSWKIHYILKYNFSDSILNTYQSERYPHTRFVITLTKLTGLLFTSPLHHLLKILSILLPSKLLVFNAPPIRLKKGVFVKGKSNAYLFPQFKIKDNNAAYINTDTFLGTEFCLLIYDTRLNEQDENSLKEHGIKTLKIVANKNSINSNLILDSNKDFEKWFKKNNCHAVLIRPDRYVFNTYKNIEVRNIILDIRRTIKL
ncbi:FAD-dependent monooxygenase [Chondrinema litorale]|uniref:FAD-dependent monooxygenase n=1 Tax=Chondrinema litorale TaxID=2994555 RepID=UPI002542AF59|nr:FAD-dependent monooxygenase [Chondrinema litorale]UZR94223.1 FAD-dependent monooxygenase [Chondrinema litorale]